MDSGPRISLVLGGAAGQSAKRKRAALSEAEEDAGGERDEALTDFGGERKKAPAPLVIPLIAANVWRTQDQAEGIAEVRGRTEQQPLAQPRQAAALTTYGLVLPSKSSKQTEGDAGALPDAEPSADAAVAEPEDVKPRFNGPVTDEVAAAALLADLDKPEGSSAIVVSSIPVPILQQNAVPGLTEHLTDAEKYRHDVALRPDEATLEDYEKVPVDQFGAALLRGMGWKEGQGIGRNKKNAMLNPIEFIARPELLGLGAQPADLPAPPTKSKRPPKPGESREPRGKDYAPVELDDGRRRHYREIGVDHEVRALESRAHKEGTTVVATAGQFKGWRGTVLRFRTKGKELVYTVELERGRRVERFYEDELKVVERPRSRSRSRSGSRDRASAGGRTNGHGNADRKDERQSRSATPSGPALDDAKAKREPVPSNPSLARVQDAGRGSPAPSAASSRDRDREGRRAWLHPHLIVRVISKKLAFGDLYKRKLAVADVTRPGYATLRSDAGELYEDVSERDLETVVPGLNERVMVVAANSKQAGAVMGQLGTVVQKDKDKERVVVQFEPDLHIAELSFDDVCSVGAGAKRD
ncbi:DExH-box splicing factor binding site-domain-containing protein [Hyaloraphidium curvatum]|nr:DExH-box splicing factor binding site-domain-containing protein [Hyaloraphidium curvatum]